MPANDSSYKLSEQENSRIYYDLIEPGLLANAGSRKQVSPRLIMLGGQPGSGKTSRLRAPAEDELKNEGGFIGIDADDMRAFHPNAAALRQQDDLIAASHTQADAVAWVNHAIETAIHARCHVVLDGTMSSPQSVMERIKRFEAEGYTIEVRALAVNERQSWLNILRRYEDEKSRRGAGRMTPCEVHDEAYDGLVKSLGQVAKQANVRVRIYGCDAELFDSARQAATKKDAVSILRAEREREWTPAEREAFGRDLSDLVNVATHRKAEPETLETYRRLAQN